MVFEPSDMTYFIMSHFHSGCCIDNTLKEDRGGSRENGLGGTARER